MKDKERTVKCRKVAAHRVVTDNGIYRMAVVELEGEKVVGFRQLSGEEPFTEWLGGEIVLKQGDNGDLAAYHNLVKLTS